VILDNAPIPDVNLLPDDLKELADRQAEFVEYRTFDAGVERLIRKLRLKGVGRTGLPEQPTSAPVHASSNDRYRGEGRTKVDVTIVHGAPEGWFLPGNGKVEWFQDRPIYSTAEVPQGARCRPGSQRLPPSSIAATAGRASSYSIRGQMAGQSRLKDGDLEMTPSVLSAERKKPPSCRPAAT
jgi:hypothetical protein